MGTEVERQLQDAVIAGATLLLKKQLMSYKHLLYICTLQLLEAMNDRFQNLLLSFEFSVSPEALIVAFQEARPGGFLCERKMLLLSLPLGCCEVVSHCTVTKT